MSHDDTQSIADALPPEKLELFRSADPARSSFIYTKPPCPDCGQEPMLVIVAFGDERAMTLGFTAEQALAFLDGLSDSLETLITAEKQRHGVQ